MTLLPRLGQGWGHGLVAVAAGLLFSVSAQAALFADDEARKAILDLRTRVQQSEDAQRQRVEQLSVQNQDQLSTLRRSMLDLNAQIDALRLEVVKLRGQNEQLARDLSESQRKLGEQTQALDTRLKPLEPQKVQLDGREFQVDPEERRQYEAAMGLIRRGDFAEAATAMSGFLRRFPASGYVDSVRFWLGNAQYGKRDYKEAIASFKTFISSNPQHPKAAEALLALASSQIELKETKQARRSLEDLIKAYPGTEAAQAAKERLSSLK